MTKILKTVGSVQLSDSSPSNLGTATAGTGSSAARADHVHAMPNRARGAYDAIVYIQDGDVIAEDATGDEIDSGDASTKAGDITQSALDSVSRGAVFLSPGSYKVFETVTIPQQVTLFSNPHPVYNSDPNYYIAMIYADATFSGGTGTSGIVQMSDDSGLSAIKIKGIGGSVNGISIYDKSSILIQGCRITNCYRGLQASSGIGVQILDSEFRWCSLSAISGAYGFTDAIISRCFFPVNSGNDIVVGSGSAKIQIKDCTFEWGSVEGIKLSSTRNVMIAGCTFDRKGKEAIYVDTCTSILIGPNTYRRNAAISRDAHIYAVSSQIQFSGNEYLAYKINDDGTGAVKPDYVYEIGAGCTITYNESPVAQNVGIHKNATSPRNSGSSTGTGSEQTIAHGLVAAPSKVAIVPTETGATVSSWWADATNIYATVTSGKAFNWSAEV